MTLIPLLAYLRDVLTTHDRHYAMSDIYKIKIRAVLDDHWSDWFDNATITTEDGISVITCEVVDQAALFALLRRVRDAGLKLQSVNRIDIDDNTSSIENN